MTEITLQATEKPQVKASESERTSRLFFVDHLRAALVILVVLHHLALVYGASSPFYYVEPPFTDPRAFQILLVFVLANQAWFMGAFFLLAGYFTPGTYDRKGPGAFLRDRLVRLGIPLLVYIFVLNPVAELGVYLMPTELTGITAPLTWQSFWQAYPDLLGMGPLWFVAMLLIFTFGYALWRVLTKNRASQSKSETSGISYLAIALFVLILAAANYLVRRVVPLGESVNLFVDFLVFPTIAYLPQYLAFFILGVIASRRDWLRTLPNSMGVVGFAAAVVASVALFPLAFSGRFLSLEVTEALSDAMGNGHWQSALYALWDAVFAVGMCLAAITFFHRFVGRESRFGTFLSQQSYAVYIIHIPLIVLLAYALREIGLNSIPKFAAAALIVVPTCFFAAYLLRKIPYVSRVV